MKKTFLTCMAVVALLAIASGAGAITCTIDQRPAATLLIPYFQATFNPDLTINAGPTGLDTLVTIGNASSAPMLAHVQVWSERTELVLDFNIALTAFDIQSFSVARVLRGFLPQTPVDTAHAGPGAASLIPGADTPGFFDVCQRNPSAKVFPDPAGFLRIGNGAAGGQGIVAPNPLDNSQATTNYATGPFPLSFLQQVVDSLDVTSDSNLCTGVTPNPVNGVITNPIHGYITIDMVNYCSISNANDVGYYTNDIIGMENNLWGDYIYTSGAGVGTGGFAAVAIEADPSLADATAAPTALTGAASVPGRRTFYRRWVTSPDAGCSAGNAGLFAAAGDAFDCGAGDQREPLGLKYAARWFDGTTPVPGGVATGTTSFFDVWRASAVPSTVSGGLSDLLGFGAGKCNTSEPTVSLTFYDEDENTVTSGPCPSPCSNPPFNFPLETQRTQITTFSHPAWPAGWVSMKFFNNGGPVGGVLDQAWVTYDFQGAAAFLSAGIPAAQLDPTNCQPLGVPVAPAAGGVTPTAPVIPLLVGTGP
jgi:hypothetical protein